MKKLFAMLALALVLSLLTGSALAEWIRFEGEAPEIEASDAAGNPVDPVQAEEIILLGRSDAGDVALSAGGALVYAKEAELTEVLGGRSLADLPVLSGIAPLQRGADRALVQGFQQKLIDLGYLQGRADGTYGDMTRGAVAALQSAYGLEATGTADGATQLLADALLGEPTTVAVHADPSAQFADIADRTESDLSALYRANMVFDFDDISGLGFISNGNVVAYATPEGTADIDQYEFALRFGFTVADKGDTVTVKPALIVESTSVRRPIVQSVMLKSGDSRATVNVATVESGLAGSRSVETDTFNLNAAAAALLAGSAENSELKLRIVGKYQSFDVIAEADELEKLGEIGGVMAQFLSE